jgi:histidyl-tRNA synthetase
MADDNIPNQIVEAIAISNAKSVGEQPAILANLALANHILNSNMQHQLLISQQQAMSQIQMATLAKCVSIITRNDKEDPAKSDSVKDMVKLMQKMFEEMENSAKAHTQPPVPPPEVKNVTNI